MKINNKFMPIDNISINSSNTVNASYEATMARFEEILKNKLNIDFSNNNIIKNSLNVEKLQNIDDVVFKTYMENLKTNNQLDKMNVMMKSGESIEKINNYLKNTPLENMGYIFKEAEEKYGVNAYFLTAIAVLESDFGRSNIARDKNNLFGYGAYDNSPYKMARKFETMDAGVFKVAKHLSENYLNENGKYFNGYDIESVGKRYATDKSWSKKVAIIVDKIIQSGESI